MLNEINISTNISAMSSAKNTGGTYDTLARISASIPIDGNWSTAKTVINAKVYNENAERAAQDYGLFEQKIGELAGKITPIINNLMEEFKQELEKELAQG